MGKHLDALRIPFYPAHGSNFTVGRHRPIRYITIHHMAGTPDTLRYLWQNPNRNASSHFGVFPGYIEQYVAVGNTAWCNGNFDSNGESITIETYGDWRNGRTYNVIPQLEALIEAIRRDIAISGQTYHQDVSLKFTECPAQLRAHAKAAFDRVTARLNAPAPTPTPPASQITYEKIAKKTVLLKWAANLWNFNFNDWASAKSVQGYPKGYAIEVVAIAKNALGGRYYMTQYSYNDGNIRATNGFNVVDCEDLPAPAPTPPAPEPTPVPPKVDVKYIKYDKVITVEAINEPTKLWDFNAAKWADFKEVDKFAKGSRIDIVGEAEHPLGGHYLMTAYSFGQADAVGTPHKTWGFNAVDVKEVASAPAPTEPPTTEPGPTDPTQPDEGPTNAGPGDVLQPTPGEDAASWLERFWKTPLGRAIIAVLSKFKFGG